MTEQSSCKSFFGAYLIYRVKSQKMNLILSCMLNLFTLPLFVFGKFIGSKDEFSQFYFFGTFFSVVCGIFLIVITVIGAVYVFDLYHRKDLTDTIGCLPLTYRQRFWGDFLAGYIANVAPSVPFGLGTAIFFGAYGGFEEFEQSVGFTKLQFMLGMAVSLFFAMTFTYLFTVLVVSACGTAVHSVLFTIFGTAALTGTVAGFAGCFAVGMIGVDPSGYMSNATAFMPPFGSIKDLYLGAVFLSGSPLELFGGNMWYHSGRRFFVSLDVPNIVWFVILGAAVIFGAYCLGKHRKTEKAGSPFAVKPVFYVISALSCAAAVFVMTVRFNGSTASPGSSLLALFAAAGVGGVVCAVSVVMYLPKKKVLPKCILCGILAIGASAGTVALLKQTCSFGAAYLPENAKEIEYIMTNYGYTITDKSDIKKYIKNHNDILRENHDTLGYGHYVIIEYKTSNGKISRRRYSNFGGSENDATLKMDENATTLSGYGRYFFEAESVQSADGCRITEGNISYEIPEQDYKEFIETLSREAAEKYDPEAEVYAKASFTNEYYYQTFDIDIGKNFKDTAALLERIKATIEPDPNEIVWMIDYRSAGADKGALKVNIRNGDMDDPLVKELVGLLKAENDPVPFDDDFMAYFKSYASDTGWDYYYVPRGSSKRALEIMVQLVINEREAQEI